MWTVVALFSWVVLHVPIKPYDLVINHKHTHTYITKGYHDQHSSYCKRFILTIPSYSKLSISTQNIYLKGVVQGQGDKSLVMSLKRWFSHQVYAIQQLKVKLVIMQLFRTKKNMQREKSTCLPCLNIGVLLQTLALDLLQLAAHLKLARCLRAHKNTYNKQNNTPSKGKLIWQKKQITR
jgi:hypothetical protein